MWLCLSGRVQILPTYFFVYLGLKIDLSHLMFIAVSERLPAARGGETNVENLVKEVLGLFETRAFSRERMWKKWLMVLYCVWAMKA